MHIKLKRTPGIYLTGFMGSGKSTVGKLLADRLGWDFIDLDEHIQAREHMTVAAIFAERGEAAFREVETAEIRHCLRKIECGIPAVISLGGGAFVQPGNYELLGDNGVSVWLDCSLEVAETRIAQVDDRPLARDKENFRRLFRERRVAYGRADYRVNGDLDISDAVDAILALPLWK